LQPKPYQASPGGDHLNFQLDSGHAPQSGTSGKTSIESGLPKIILVPHFKGAISWWGRVGLAEPGTEQKVLVYDAASWLLERAKLANDFKATEAQKFAEELASEMNYRLKEFLMDEDEGIGLHFTAYERIETEWVPEFFLITSFTGFTPGGAYPAGQSIIALRQTYHTLSQNKDFDFAAHGSEPFRNKVLEHLKTDKIHVFTYNNGHVVQFSGYQPFLDILMNQTKNSEYSFSDGRPLFIVRTMVEAQERFRPVNQRAIGGPCCELIIDPLAAEVYSSNTHEISAFLTGT
jgi:hypothetical protein